MCGIFGAIFPSGDHGDGRVAALREATKARGRDGSHVEVSRVTGLGLVILGHHRAAPTTEPEHVAPQPYSGILHNGTIANDRELGNPPGQVDSAILPAVLDRTSVRALADSLGRVAGSFALAVLADATVYLAANYKPLFYYRAPDGARFFSNVAGALEQITEPGTAPCRLPPYSVLDLATLESARLPRVTHRRALVIASAGLDSTVAAALVREQGYEITLLHFLYGCTAQPREQGRIRRLSEALGASHVFRTLDYRGMAGGSPLLDPVAAVAAPIAGAELAHEWVPARNLLMIASAVAYAEANGYGAVVLGGNLEEAGAYPDNEPEFVRLLDAALDYAVGANREVRLLSPLGNLMKHEIVRRGVELGVPFDLTWSCYRDGESHCGECGPCYMRRTAFERNGLTDPVFAHFVEQGVDVGVRDHPDPKPTPGEVVVDPAPPQGIGRFFAKVGT